MALKHFSKVFAVHDAAVSPLLTDPEGGTPTYGDSIDVPGIKSVTLTGTMETKTLRGDNKQLDRTSVLTELNVELEYAKMSLDILAAGLALTVSDSGTTPSQVATVDILGSSTNPAPFKFEAVTTGVDTIGGDLLLTVWNASFSSFPELGMAEEDYKTSPLSLATTPLLSTDKWLTVSLRETAALLGS